MTNYIYAYTTTSHAESWTRVSGQTGDFRIKVGQSIHPGEQRIRQQLSTPFPNLEGVTILFHSEPAQAPDGTDFTDHDIHRILKNAGVNNTGGEWFEATLDEVRGAIVSLQKNVTFSPTRTQTFGMRDEQQDAVDQTASYFRANAKAASAPRFLWNAKMRFGKTFTAYQLAREMGWTRVLVLTYKPAVQSAWRTDLQSHVDFINWQFVDRGTTVSEADALSSGEDPLVWFASFQDLMGKDVDGHVKKHNETIHLTEWDCIVIDEFHFGAWNDSARELYDPTDKKLMEAEAPEVDELVTDTDLGLKSKFHLHLSGTPFRAITNGEYIEDQVYNWTYIDEQRAKANWDESRGPNRYAELPQMQMFTYTMGAQAEEWADDGEFNGFSLNAYFKASVQGKDYVFDDPDRVAEFMQMLRGKKQIKQQIIEGNKPPFPYEAAKFTEATRHSVWFMNRVAECEAMAAMLRADPYFSTFEIHVAAGTKAGTGASSLPPVQAAIKRSVKEGKSGTITLSCGKLMTGVTVPEWSSIFMLRSLKSPESYFQAAFRVQSPWKHEAEIKKNTCYVFEFDPNRALSLVALYGTELANNDPSRTTTQRDILGELINYLPIFAIDGGSFGQLDTDAVLDWANAGVSANSLARKWGSYQLFDLNSVTMGKLLEDADLLAELEQIEDFRNIRTIAEKMVTETEKLKDAKRDQKPNEEREHRKSVNEQRKSIREKLRKISAKVLIFMYLTDFREEALVHVIESLDSDLFLRSTGLSLEAFRKLNNEVRVFNLTQMEDAIRKFRYFEEKSLESAR